MSGRPLAVLDANVLYPFQTRNFLLHLAVFDLFDPLWSEEIVREMGRNLVSDGAVNRDQLSHLVGEMLRHFPEAWGHGYEGRADHLTVPDESDRHVIALALHYEAEYVITHNKKDFPEAVLDRIGVQALDPVSLSLGPGVTIWKTSCSQPKRTASRSVLSNTRVAVEIPEAQGQQDRVPTRFEE